MLWKPLPHRRGDSFEVGLEAVVPGHRDHLAGRAASWHAKRISFALHHESRHLHGVELGLTRLLRPTWRMQREGQTEHGGRAAVRHGSAGHTGPGRAAADDQGHATQFAVAQVLDDRPPGLVELGGWSR